jgi:hypothetical protein
MAVRKMAAVPFIIKPSHVMRIIRCSKSTAGRKLCKIRDALGKPEEGLITLKEYCNYEALDINDVISLFL